MVGGVVVDRQVGTADRGTCAHRDVETHRHRGVEVLADDRKWLMLAQYEEDIYLTKSMTL